MTPEREKHIREWVAVAPTLFGAASDWMKELLEEIDRLRAEESAAQTWNCRVEKKEAKNG